MVFTIVRTTRVAVKAEKTFNFPPPKYQQMAKKLVRFDWAMKKMLCHKANFDNR